MGKRQKNRVAWRLVMAVTRVLLGAVTVLGVRYAPRLLRGEEVARISLAPRDCWGFGWSTLMMSFGPGGLSREWLVVGCLAWRVEYDTPKTVASPSPHRSWWRDASTE
jgi:hypothetical protein